MSEASAVVQQQLLDSLKSSGLIDGGCRKALFSIMIEAKRHDLKCKNVQTGSCQLRIDYFIEDE